MSTEIPYSPIGTRKTVTFKRMQEILAKHAPKTENVVSTERKENDSPSAVCNTSSPESRGTEREASRLKRMKWRALNDDTIESNFGYRILRCTADGKPTGRFVAFVVRGEKKTVLGGYDSGEDARVACDAHHALEMAAV